MTSNTKTLESEIPLNRRFEAMLLHDGKELKGHATRLLRSGLPLPSRRFAGIRITGEYRLADAKRWRPADGGQWRKRATSDPTDLYLPEPKILHPYPLNRFGAKHPR